MVDELRKKTVDAIAEGKRKKAAKEAEDRAANLRQKVEWHAIACSAIDKIPSICEKAAEKGLFEAKVFRLQYNRDYESNGALYNTLNYSQLRGPAALIWNWCQQAELNTTVQYGHDGCGVDSWYDIVVNWK